MFIKLTVLQSRIRKLNNSSVRAADTTWLLSNAPFSKRLATEAKPNIELPKSTKVIICGGGLVGTSIAYHLTQFGYKDIVLVTRNK
jgi:hypothetical protein